MNDQDYLLRLSKRIEWIYEHISLSPHVFAHVIAIETYVMAIEELLNAVNNCSNRHDCYRTYLGELGFGMGRFETQFERDNRCDMVFIPVDEVNAEKRDELKEKYLREFRSHWEAFLAWRREKKNK